MTTVIQILRLSAVMHGIVFLISGCGTSKVARQKTMKAEFYKPLVVENTERDKRPDWTSENPFYEDSEALYFTGGFIGGADYAVTLRLAKAEAMKNLLESIQVKTRSEFSTAINGQNRADEDLGRYMTDAVGWTVENLKIAGIRPNQIFYEQVFDPVSQRFKYNSWVQLKISTTDYAKAKMDAANKWLKKALREKDAEAEEKAMELLDKLKKEEA
jgi:hypothetical protein